MAEIDRLYPSRIGAPGSLNVFSANNKSSPAFKQFVLDSTDKLHYAVRAIEYKAPTSTGGQPRQYCAIDRKVYRIDNGTQTNDTENFQSTHDQFSSVIQGMVVYDVPVDGTPASFTQGNAGLLVSFGNGNPDPDNATFEGVYYRQLSTDSSTPWTAATEATQGTTYLTCWQMVKAGPDLYAVCDAGTSTTTGDYRISKCPAGSNPVLVASWGNGIEVGGPEWIINGLAAIGAAPIAGKPDGLYYYNEQTRRYENVLKNYELIPHALNGKVTEAVTGGVVYTTYDGGAYFFDGVSVQEITPNKYWPLLSKDIGNARITAAADAGDTIYLYTELASQSTQNAGLIVNAVSAAGAATAMTTNLVDGSFNTGSGTTLDSFAGGSFIDVWADIPFEGIIIYTTRSPNGTAAAVFDQVLYTSATDTFTAATGIIDGTRISSGGSLSYTAYPPSASAGVIMAKDLNFGSLMQKVSFNYSSGTDVTLKYGMRVRLASGNNFDADTEIDEVEIIPYRAGMPNGGIYSASTNFTSRDRSGLVGHVIAMKRERTVGFVPHDAFAVYSYPGVWAMAMHSGRLGQASGGQNLGQSLILWGRYTTTAISLSPSRDPIRSFYPHLQDVGTVAPGFLEQICWDWDGGDSTKQKVIKQIKIDTRFVDPSDQTEVFAQFDMQDIVTLGKYPGGPLTIPVNQAPFRYLNLWVGFNQNAATLENAPQFVEPFVIEFDYVDGDWPRDHAQPVPVTV